MAGGGRSLIALLLLLCALGQPAQPLVAAEQAEWAAGLAAETLREHAARTLVQDNGQTAVYESSRTIGATVLEERAYALPNGDVACMGRASSASAGVLTLEALQFEAAGGTVRYFDQTSQQWKQEALAPGLYGASMVLVELDDGQNLLFYTPKTYARLENGVLQYLPANDGGLQAEREGTGWRISVRASLPGGRNCAADFTWVWSREPLLNWSLGNCGDLWKAYTLDGTGKWCYDGYYWETPYNYQPTGTNCYYRCPAAYLVKSFAYAAPYHRAAEDLSTAMLDTLTQAQNAYGFWETSPGSEWLSGDYGIGPGFYDTRFNTDLIEIYVRVYARQGGDGLRAALERYAAFYTEFSAAHHRETANGGWLVEDYWHPAGNRTTHTSLNHQVAECIALYHMGGVLDRPDLTQLADRLLRAVQDTSARWIRGDGNLHYSVGADGSYGGQDYPYLTYNDLYQLQTLLTERNGAPDPAVAALMASKRQWMDANGITGYLTADA